MSIRSDIVHVREGIKTGEWKPADGEAMIRELEAQLQAQIAARQSSQPESESRP